MMPAALPARAVPRRVEDGGGRLEERLIAELERVVRAQPLERRICRERTALAQRIRIASSSVSTAAI